MGAVYGAEASLHHCDVGPRHPRLQQEAARPAGAGQRDALCPQRIHHHLPRLAEIVEQRQPAVCPAACHRVPAGRRLRIQAALTGAAFLQKILC